jgi:hypothetical protein
MLAQLQALSVLVGQLKVREFGPWFQVRVDFHVDLRYYGVAFIQAARFVTKQDDASTDRDYRRCLEV